MHRILLPALLLVLASFNCLGQIHFKKGYYIDKQGNKTECFIRDLDWKYGPKSFNYRLTESGTTEKMDTDDVTEFVVANSKYIHANVQYDQSSQDLKKVTINSGPDWLKANLLLRVVVEGKARLYHYNTANYSLFFFSVDGSPIEQLVFRNYLNPKDVTQLVPNTLYLSQLNGRVKCADDAPVNARQVPYQLKPLATQFRNFNKCSGSVVEELPRQKPSVAIRLTPGVDFSKASAIRGNIASIYDFGSNTRFRLGVDVQLALPFNYGKWAIVAEPTYQSFDSNKDGGLKYKTIEFPVGVRHRFFLSEKSSIFINGMVLLDFPIEHTQKVSTFGSTATLSSVHGCFGTSVGVGFAVGRLSLEGRYYPQRERSEGTIMIYHYTKSSIILGLRIF